MICPDCGQTLSSGAACGNCINNKIGKRRSGRGLPAYKKYPIGNNVSWKIRSGKKSRARRNRTGRPSVPIEGPLKQGWQVQLLENPLQASTLKRQRLGVNQFIEDVYRPGLLISDILKWRGYSERQIVGVKNEVAYYLAVLVAAWCNRWRSNFTSRQIYIVAHFYSFNGQIPEDRKYLAQKLQIPIEDITNELNVAIGRLRRQHKKPLEQLIVDTATKILPDSKSR